MLALLKKDKERIETAYCTFLERLKIYLEGYDELTTLELYGLIVQLLKNGNFSSGHTFRTDATFDYLYLPNLNYEGAYLMYGVGCCRHMSSLINDILEHLGFECALQYVLIDENNNWKLLEKPVGSNHVIVSLQDHENQYLLDPMNDFIFQKKENIFVPMTIESSPFDQLSLPSYRDESVEEIAKILQKYYTCKAIGIENIYE